MVFRGQTLGKYRILEPLGSGGFGTVYLAEDTWIDKKVALKVPHKQGLDFSELLKEPRLLASMSHPNIVTVITAEKEGDVFFIVMEYVAGQTLEHLIMREGPLDLARALDFACQMCNAVDHAHRAGVLHRDLRPGNMLISETGMLKVTDFGTSRFLEIAAHGTTVIGSPPYMAPEQFYGKSVFASDVYSLGLTLYELLAMRPAFDAKDRNQLIQQVRHLTQSVKNLALMDVYGRVARLIMDLAREKDGRRVIDPKPTQQDMAVRVGASREMISRILKDLTAGGYIRIDGAQMVIEKDPPRAW